MNAYLEVMTGGGGTFPLEGDTLTIGRDHASDVPLAFDPKVSNIHAVIQRYQSAWSVRDVGSRNGTFVNGQRVRSELPLRSRDEIGVGDTRLRFRADAAVTIATSSAEGPPSLTPAERRVLVELCRPLISGDAFPQPASVTELAAGLVIGEETVKWHLKNLTRKFGIEEGTSRRVALANDAIRRRAVTLAELREPAQ